MISYFSIFLYFVNKDFESIKFSIDFSNFNKDKLLGNKYNLEIIFLI